MLLSFPQRSFFLQLSFWLTVKALVMIGIILYAGIGLGPDEAQYWTWSQALDWGYYSKPPGIAWQIALGTTLFGQTEMGIRALSIVLAVLQAFALYYLALQAGLRSYTAFWCALCLAFCPIGILGSFFAITDGGLLLCWIGACYVLVSALSQNQAPACWKIGLWILAGALFKWPIYLFWPFFLLCRFWYFPTQKMTTIFNGIFISLLGLLPSIWWNAAHDWPTFRHVFATVQGGSGAPAAGNVGAFLGAQAALLSPILFLLLVSGLWHWFKQRKHLSPPLFFCGFVTLCLLAAMTFMACFQKIQGNWIVFAYPTGLLVLCWAAFEKLPKQIKWVKIGLGLSILCTSALFALPSLYQLPRLSAYATAYPLNPLKHNLGWEALQAALKRQGYRANYHFLLSDKYQTTSLLSFYNEGHKRAYFLNLQGIRNNQFSYWPSLQAEQKGKIGYFVWTENMPILKREWQIKRELYEKELQVYFEKVTFLEWAPLVYEGPKIVKAAGIFRCENCKDTLPVHSTLY